MPDEEDTALDERRLMGEARDRTEAYVASSLGLTRVEISGDQVGRFSLVYRGRTTDVASREGKLVVGTAEDVLVASGEEFAQTAFGPARAVTLVDGQPVAVSPEGEVARLVGDDWHRLGEVLGPGRMDGNLLASSDGVYRIGEELTHLGGEAVRDVAGVGRYAATGSGLFEYDGGWHRVVEGDCTLVVATDGHAHGIGQAGLLERVDGEWTVTSLPTDAPIADLGHGESLYAVTADGTFLIRASPEVTPDGKGGWRSRALGVPEVAGLAVV